jgi:hypothetical protein
MADGVFVIPAKAGIQSLRKKGWMPAFAGMTSGRVATQNTQIFIAAQKLLL